MFEDKRVIPKIVSEKIEILIKYYETRIAGLGVFVWLLQYA